MVNFNWLIAGQPPDGDDNNKLVILLVDVHESIDLGVPDASSGHSNAQIAFLEQGRIYHEFVIGFFFLNKLTDLVGNVVGDFSAFVIVKLF